MMQLDIEYFRLINDQAGISAIFDQMVLFANKYSIGFFSAILLFYLFRKRRIFWTAILSAGLSRGILTEAIAFLYRRPRPFEELQNVHVLIDVNSSASSFPSGHAAFLFAIAFSIFIYQRKIGTVLILLALGISLGRIYLGVHYPSDCLGGILLAGVSVWIVRRFRR
jgi:undecaprenyl-diphosphatase